MSLLKNFPLKRPQSADWTLSNAHRLPVFSSNLKLNDRFVCRIYAFMCFAPVCFDLIYLPAEFSIRADWPQSRDVEQRAMKLLYIKQQSELKVKINCISQTQDLTFIWNDIWMLSLLPSPSTESHLSCFIRHQVLINSLLKQTTQEAFYLLP